MASTRTYSNNDEEEITGKEELEATDNSLLGLGNKFPLIISLI